MVIKISKDLMRKYKVLLAENQSLKKKEVGVKALKKELDEETREIFSKANSEMLNDAQLKKAEFVCKSKNDVETVTVNLIQTKVATFKIDEAKKIFDKEILKKILVNKAVVVNVDRLMELLRDAGFTQKELSNVVQFSKEINDKELERLLSIGVIKEEDARKIMSVKVSSEYFKYK